MNRQENLIQILLKAEKPLTTQELAEQLNVSSRTIRSDLEKIESEILVHSMKLEKKPRVGIWIEGTQDEKDALFLDVKGEHDLVESYSKEYRRGCILVQILLSKNKIYPYKLQNNLYVSKSTIEKDLQEISKWLEKYDLSLMKKPSIGLYVSGDEENIRNAVAALAGELSEKNQSIESLMETYLDIDVKEIEDIIHNWNDNYNMHLNEVNINNLAFHASVMLMRIGKNKALLIENSKALDSETFSYKEEFDILIKELSTYGNCEIPKDEADYLLMHLLGMYLNESSFLENDFLNDLRKIAENIAEDFILKSDKIMSLDLESNDQFKRSLMLHLLPTVYRLKYGLNLYNPLLNEIKTNYASYYYLALIINSSFKKYIVVNASEGEIAYVALHLSVAVQQAKDHVQVAVVCSLGVGVSRLLSVKLQENFPDVTFIHCSMNDEEQLEKCKYIISTVELNTDKPYVQVNPLLMEVDVQKIRTLLRKNPSINKTNFSMQTVKVFHEQIDKIQILQEMSNYLRMCGAVTPRFFEGVLKRENMGSTEVGDGIILTHGFHEDVKRTQIAFCKLDHPIVWKTQEVDFIVMLAVAKTDAKNVMQMNWLYKMLSNMEIVNKIRECKKDREIYETLIEASKKL